MLKFLKTFFGAKSTVSPCDDVPYKVETPVSETKPKRKTAAEKKPVPAKKATPKPRAKK
jgi:hypothetical protein